MPEPIEFETDREVLQAAIKMWGLTMQEDIAIEEMSELMRAIVKKRRNPIKLGLTDKIVEEIADVQIMIWQLAEVYGRVEVNNMIVEKFERLGTRLEEASLS